jgi:hypothetical protein
MFGDAFKRAWWEPVFAIIGAAAIYVGSSMAWSSAVKAGIGSRIDWNQQVEVSLAALPQGQAYQLVVGGRVVIVAHLIEEDISKALAVDPEHLPYPASIANRLRPGPDGKIKPQYAVFHASDESGCLVTFRRNGFLNSCTGTKYDVFGRKLKRGGLHGNLFIPRYEFEAEGIIVLLPGGGDRALP